MTQEPEIRDLAAQPAVVEHAVTDAAGMRATIDRAFPALFARLAGQGVAPAGPPYIRYLETGRRLEIELGVPVQDDASGGGELPGGRTAVLRHIGAYEDLRGAVERLQSWVAAHDEEPAGPFWEVYVTNPRDEPDPSKRITDIYQPLR